MFGFGALVFLVAVLEHQLHWTMLLLPLVAVPQLIFLVGLSALSAVAGTYLPDIKETLRAVVRILFFVTPILWPADRVPDYLRWVVIYNPLAFLVEGYRDLALEGTLPNASATLYFTLFATALCIGGLVLFVRVKKRFADLL
ncbi:MAG: ABC transporter permease [Rubrobacter sp.]